MSNAPVAVFIGTMLLAGCWGLAWTVRRLWSGRPLLESVPRRPARCGMLHVTIVFAYILLQIPGKVAALVGDPQPVPPQAPPAEINPWLLLQFAGLELLVTLAVIATLTRRSHSKLADLGFGPIVDGRNAVAVGVAGFFVVLLPVFGLQLGLNLLFPESGEHPLTKALAENRDPLLLLASFVTAVVAAPIAEEFFVRGMLQGWLESLWLRRWGATAAPEPCEPTPAETAAEIKPVLPDAADGQAANSYAPSQQAGGSPLPESGGGPPLMLGPILISSLVFALMHLGHGTAPVPLFVFALGLGYVFQRTHHLLPCIVMHASLNTCTLLGLWLSPV